MFEVKVMHVSIVDLSYKLHIRQTLQLPQRYSFEHLLSNDIRCSRWPLTSFHFFAIISNNIITKGVLGCFASTRTGPSVKMFLIYLIVCSIVRFVLIFVCLFLLLFAASWLLSSLDVCTSFLLLSWLLSLYLRLVAYVYLFVSAFSSPSWFICLFLYVTSICFSVWLSVSVSAGPD